MTVVPTDLAEQLRERRVIPFVGAGVSMAVHDCGGQRVFPDWRTLVNRGCAALEGANKSDKAHAARALAGIDDLIRAAELIREHLPSSRWADFLRKQFDPDPDAVSIDESSLELPRLVWRLGATRIITTNFDPVLRWTAPNPRHFDVWGSSQPPELGAWLRGTLTRPGVWHLHGHVSDIDGIVLTKSDFDRLYGEHGRQRAAVETLRHRMTNRSFLFLGFSFSDPYLRAQLRWVLETFDGHGATHYVLARTGDDISRLRDLGLEVIEFAGFGDPLLEVMRELAGAAGSDPDTSSAAGGGVSIGSGTRSPGLDLQPLHFTAFLQERRRDFTGRRWLFEDRIEPWGGDPKARRSVLVVGDPGIGKSAIVAAQHCCRSGFAPTLDPARFVESIAAWLQDRVPGLAEEFERPEIAEHLAGDRLSADPVSAFQLGLLEALARVEPPADGEPRFLAIDALDEAESSRGRASTPQLLSACIRQFPDWLRIFATSRREDAVLAPLRGRLDEEIIDAHDRDNLDDVREYVRSKLTGGDVEARLRDAGTSPVEAADTLAERSKGNFYYATRAVEAIEQGVLDLERLDDLPGDLPGLYEEFFRRAFTSGDDDAYAGARAILGPLVAAQEPVERSLLAEAAEVEPIVLERRLRDWRLRQYLREHEGGLLSIYHKSFSDWLLDRTTNLDFGIDLADGHARLASACECRRAAGAGRFAAACDVVLCADWLVTKLDREGVASLIADCETAAP